MALSMAYGSRSAGDAAERPSKQALLAILLNRWVVGVAYRRFTGGEDF